MRGSNCQEYLITECFLPCELVGTHTRFLLKLVGFSELARLMFGWFVARSLELVLTIDCLNSHSWLIKRRVSNTIENAPKKNAYNDLNESIKKQWIHLVWFPINSMLGCCFQPIMHPYNSIELDFDYNSTYKLCFASYSFVLSLLKNGASDISKKKLLLNGWKNCWCRWQLDWMLM